MVKAKKYIYAKYFDGLPKEGDLKIVEEELPPLKKDEYLTEAVYISIDPYQRVFATLGQIELGSTFYGSQIAKVIESKNPKFPVGKYVVGEFGWRTHTIADNSKDPREWVVPPFIINDFEGLPLSLAVGILGMPGVSAYFGFLEGCEPKAGDTVVVSGAAGAVGSIVGQIAKIKGCTVVGICGSDEKGKWLVNDLKFDDYVNYKDKDFKTKLAKAVPKGVDCYFDNVSGPITSTVLNLMNQRGRIAVIGIISGYNNPEEAKTEAVQWAMVAKRLTMRGVSCEVDRWSEAVDQLKKWVREGKLKYKETVTEGFENTFKAFVSMLQGGNYGKAIVKI